FAFQSLFCNRRQVRLRNSEIAKAPREPETLNEIRGGLADVLSESHVSRPGDSDVEQRRQLSVRFPRNRKVKPHRVRQDNPVEDAVRCVVPSSENVAEAVMDSHARLREDESRLHGTLEHPIAVHQIPRVLHRVWQRVEDPPRGPQTERRGLGRADGAATAEPHERVRLPGARLPRDFLRGRFGHMRLGSRIRPYESVAEGFADSSANRSTREVSSRHQIRTRGPEFAEKRPQIPDGSKTQDDERLSLLPPDPWHGLRGLRHRPRPLRDRPRIGTIRTQDGPRKAIRPLLAPPTGAREGRRR